VLDIKLRIPVLLVHPPALADDLVDVLFASPTRFLVALDRIVTATTMAF